MSEILKGMTREQALGCVFTSEDGSEYFCYNGKAYLCPTKIGIEDVTHECEMADFSPSINAYFDEQEKPKWVKVEHRYGIFDPGSGKYVCIYQKDTSNYAERGEIIDRINAQSKIEAFIRENGGSGDCFIWFNDSDSVFCVSTTSVNRIGAIMCAARDLAQAVIELFPDELRLLAGVT